MTDANVKGYRRRNGAQETGDGGQDGSLGALVVAGEDDGPIITSDSALAKSAAGFTITASGDTNLITASPTQVLTIYWISAINDPDASSTPLLSFTLGTTEIYRLYAMSHREKFVGAAGDDLKVNLDQSGGSVSITVHYTLV